MANTCFLQNILLVLYRERRENNVCNIRCLKTFGFRSDFLRRKFVGLDSSWEYSKPLKIYIECLVILRITFIFWCWLLYCGQMAEIQQ